MSWLTNNYKNKPFVRPFVLLALGAALGAGGQAYLSPVLLPLIHEMLCGGKEGCSMNMPNVPELPQKPEKEKVCVVVDGVKVCN